MNMHDIAQETGYSIATISRAINNSGYVSKKTREKIMKVIDEKGYSVNPFAKGMATSTMSIAGILSTDSRDLYQAECIYYLQNDLRDVGFTALLACTGLDLKNKQEAIRLLLSRNVDAIFLIGSQFVENSEKDNMYLKEAAGKVPVIIMNGLLEYPNIYSLRCDDQRGMFEMTQLTLMRGSKKPLMIARRPTFSTMQKKLGFEQACALQNVKGEYIEIEEGIGFAGRFFEKLSEMDFDALLCADDEMANLALKHCQTRGIAVPGQCQITGYNNSRLSLLSAQEITSYDNRLEYLCASSVLCMQNILAKKDYPTQSVYTGFLSERQTTRKN